MLHQKKLRGLIRFALLCGCALTMALSVKAQGPGGPGDGSGGDPDQNVPLDGGLSVLAGGAIAYAVRKYRKRNGDDQAA